MSEEQKFDPRLAMINKIEIAKEYLLSGGDEEPESAEVSEKLSSKEKAGISDKIDSEEHQWVE
jgi:hypothetical protein